MNRLVTLLSLLSLPLLGQGVPSSFTNSTVTTIPDGNPVGMREQFAVSGISGEVSNVTVRLDITGGFNGDLYAYLVNPQGQLAILLNRVGVGGSNPFGYSDDGFNVTLAAIGNNVHYYNNDTPTIVGGQLTGTWAADGRNINPQSNPGLFDSASLNQGLNIYSGANGSDVNGAWTLFVADLASGGGSPSLNLAILSIMTVPEPKSWVLFLVGGLMTWGLLRKRPYVW
jgi:subtilisin-like proprotein convertase family protein